MKELLFLFIFLLTSCYQSNKPFIKIKECVVNHIEERVQSTLDITKKYKVVTDCGDTIISKDIPKIGSKIYIQEIYYTK